MFSDRQGRQMFLCTGGSELGSGTSFSFTFGGADPESHVPYHTIPYHIIQFVSVANYGYSKKVS